MAEFIFSITRGFYGDTVPLNQILAAFCLPWL